MGSHSWTCQLLQMVGGTLCFCVATPTHVYVLILTDAEMEASLEYNPFTREWAVRRSDEDVTGLVTKLQAAKV